MLVVGRLTSAVIVGQIKLNTQHRLNHYVFNLYDQPFNIFTLLSQCIHQTSDTTLVTKIVIHTRSLTKNSVVFIMCVIGQMNKHVFESLTVPLHLDFLIFFGGKSNEALFVKENLHGITRKNQNVNANVKL